MQATTRFHDSITNPVLEEAEFVFHDPIVFHPTNGVFNPDSDRRDPSIGGLLRRRECTSPGFFLGLDDGAPSQDASLETHLLVETTPKRQVIARQFREAFTMCLARIGRTQEAHGTGRIDHEQVFDRVALLLAPVRLLLLLGIARTVAWSLSTIMLKRGDVGPLVRLCGREEGGSLVGRTGRQQLLLSSCLIQHRMEERNPLVGIRLGHPKELSLHFLERMLFQVGRHKEQFVGYGE
jgi:hypothetical protein